MSKPKVLKEQPEGQPVATWNAFKRVVKYMETLTDEQIASLHYETWHEAYMRANGRIQEEK